MSFLRRRLFRLRDFLVKMWLWNGRSQRILPLAVLLNRLAAPLFVFIFGMVLYLSPIGQGDAPSAASRKKANLCTPPPVGMQGKTWT